MDDAVARARALGIAGFKSDEADGEDQLGIEKEVEALCIVLAAKDIEPPISLGLFGDWGSGKSFFMKKMEDWFKSTQLAQQILHDDPFREDIHCLLMRSHAALGNKSAVKEQYESLRRLLEAELGVEPSAETNKIYQELISGEQVD